MLFPLVLSLLTTEKNLSLSYLHEIFTQVEKIPLHLFCSRLNTANSLCLFIRLMLQFLHYLCDPSLDLLQHVHVSLGSPALYTASGYDSASVKGSPPLTWMLSLLCHFCILVSRFGLVQPGSCDKGVKGPMDPCTGEGKEKCRKMGLNEKEQQQQTKGKKNLLY